MFGDFMAVQECIEKYLRLGHNECPKCRVKVSSRRALRQDQLFDGLIRALYPDIHHFQAHEDDLISRVNLKSHAQYMQDWSMAAMHHFENSQTLCLLLHEAFY